MLSLLLLFTFVKVMKWLCAVDRTLRSSYILKWLGHSVKVMKWPCAVDRTLRSSYLSDLNIPSRSQWHQMAETLLLLFFGLFFCCQQVLMGSTFTWLLDSLARSGYNAVVRYVGKDRWRYDIVNQGRWLMCLRTWWKPVSIFCSSCGRFESPIQLELWSGSYISPHDQT